MKIDLCEYDKERWPPTVCQELIRNKFMFGLTDDNVKERLLRETDFTLSKAMETVQQIELFKKKWARPSVNTVQESE